jgi:hypothetical protein
MCYKYNNDFPEVIQFNKKIICFDKKSFEQLKQLDNYFEKTKLMIVLTASVLFVTCRKY